MAIQLRNTHRTSYSATSSGIYRAGSHAGDYFMLMADPFNAKPVSRPDDDANPHILKTVVYNQNYTPPVANAAGMIVFPTVSMKQAIRVYGYDSATQTMNWVQNILPDQLLSENFIRGRPLAAALKVFSNTLASGNFALSGSMNAIPYIALPPLTQIQPGTLTTYRMDDISVVSNVSAMEGVSMVGPLYGSAQYEVFDTITTPSRSIDLAITNVNYTVTTSNNGPECINNAWNDGVYPGLLGTGSVPSPLPWGRVRAEVSVSIKSNDVPGGALLTGTISLLVQTNEADPNTYAQQVTQLTVLSQPFDISASTGGSVSFIWDGYLDPEVSNIIVVYERTSGAGDVVLTSNANYYFSDYYRYATKEPGVIALFQNITANQQLSISGVSHWEVVPNQTLVQNLKSTYALDDPAQYVAATVALISRLGAPYRWVYPRLEYDALVANGAFQRPAEEVLARAGTYRAGFLDVLKKVGRAIAAPALGVVGGALGGPAGAMLGSQLGMAISRPYQGRAGTSGRTTYRASTNGLELGGDPPGLFADPLSDNDELDTLTPMEAEQILRVEEMIDQQHNDLPDPPPLAQDKLQKLLDQHEREEKLRAEGKPIQAILQASGKRKVVDYDDDEEAELEEDPGPPRKLLALTAAAEEEYQDYKSIFRKPNGKFAYTSDPFKTMKVSNPFNFEERIKPALAREAAWALCALAVGEEAILAHLIISKRPLRITRIIGEASFDNKCAYRAVGPKVFIENHIQETTQDPAFWASCEPLIDKWGAAYVTLVPFQAPLLETSGRSYEFAYLAAALGLPSDNIYTGANDPGTTTSDVEVKVGIAQEVNRIIFIANPDPADIERINGYLANINCKLFSSYPLWDTEEVVGFAGATGELVSTALLAAAVGHQKLSVTAEAFEPESIKKGKVAQQKVREEEREGSVRMFDGTRVTKAEVLGAWPAILKRMADSGYFEVIGTDARNSYEKSSRDADTIDKSWRKLATLQYNFEKWLGAKKKTKKGAPKKDKNFFLERMANLGKRPV